MAFSNMHTKMKIADQTGTSNPPPKFIKPSDYANWRSRFENYIALLDPELLVCLTTEYVDKDGYIMERKAYDALTMCLSRDIRMLFPNKKTSCALWEAIAMRFGGQDTLKTSRSAEEITEKLLQKDEKIKALQSQILTMENERKEMRLKIVGLEQKITEFADQLTAMKKLQVDHVLAIKMVQDLREQTDKASQSSKPPVKDKKNIYTDKSSEPLLRMVRTKMISKFTNYSLQNNKKYFEKSQSTKQRVHQNVDCYEDFGYSQSVKGSVSFQKPKRAFKPTQLPESRQTKSCVYRRAQMFALAPPRCHHMVRRRPKDFVPFSPRENRLALVPRTEFRHETTRFIFRWNSISLDYIDASYKRLSKLSKTIGSVLNWVPKVVVWILSTGSNIYL